MKTHLTNYARGGARVRTRKHRLGAHYALRKENGEHIGRLKLVTGGVRGRLWRAVAPDLSVVGEYLHLSGARFALVRRFEREFGTI